MKLLRGSLIAVVNLMVLLFLIDLVEANGPELNLLWPVQNPKLERGFLSGHEAIDIRNSQQPENATIHAVEKGKIVSAGWDDYGCNVLKPPKCGGYMVVIHHDEIAEGKYYTLYAHLKKDTFLTEGKVAKGQKIAIMGNTGTSYGTHLHFELREGRYGLHIDPIKNDLFSGEPNPNPNPILASNVEANPNPVVGEDNISFTFSIENIGGTEQIIEEIFVRVKTSGGSEWKASVPERKAVPPGGTEVFVASAVTSNETGIWQIDEISFKDDNDAWFSLNNPNDHLLKQDFSVIRFPFIIIDTPNFPVVEPQTETVITLTLQNISGETWNAGDYSLVKIEGEDLTLQSQLAMDVPVPPGHPVEWKITVTSPPTPDIYVTTWRFSHKGKLYGPPIWIVLTVVPEGSSQEMIGIIEGWLEQLGQNALDRFEEEFEKIKQQITELILAEINRVINEAVKAMCGSPCVGLPLLLAGLFLGHRRHKWSKTSDANE